MARPLRIQYPGAIYHVMNRGIRHAPIFIDGDDRPLFRQTLSDTVKRHKVQIHAFSLMDNHYHLLLETPLGNLSRAMQQVDGCYTQLFNRTHGRDGPLMKGRFKSILVQEETYFVELVRYIHLNGVRAGRFPSARVDSDSSHWDYLHPLQAVPWLFRDRVMSHFSHNIAALDHFVHQGVSEDLAQTLARRRWPAILGTKDFIENIRLKYLSIDEPETDKPQARELRMVSTIEPNQVISEVLEAYRFLCGKPGLLPPLNAEARWVLLQALRSYAQLTYEEIALLIGGVSYFAVAKFLSRNNYADKPLFRGVQQRLDSLTSNVQI